MPLARIGIGSNIGDAAANVRAAFDALSAAGVVTARSSLYRTKAWGVTDQADFYNAAALLETTLSPRALLLALKTIEEEMGRTQTYRWGPRVIDLDILAYDDIEMNESDLTIPHAGLYERAFALVPLAEIDVHFEACVHNLSRAQRAGVIRLPA
jgi:2-amino-4-hydroxy-6-hydroxymethyldihydropteridine diphosphokinase